MEYYAMQCPNCGVWRGTQVKSIVEFTFKCTMCGKSKKVIQSRGLGPQLKIQGPYDAKSSSKNAGELNLTRGLGIELIGTKRTICEWCHQQKECVAFYFKTRRKYFCYVHYDEFKKQLMEGRWKDAKED